MANRKSAGNPALLPVCRQLLDMQASGHRGVKWRAAFARLRTTVELLEAKESPDAR